jgi:putative ABC transport system permease protein
MRRTVIAGLRAHARRFVATALAIILGVGFVAGTLIFRDTASAAFFDTFARMARNIDVAVFPPEPIDQNPPDDERPWGLTADQVAAVRRLSTVAAVDARVSAPLALLDARGRAILNFGGAGFVVSTDGEPTLRSFDVQGRVPSGPGEAVLDVDTAAHQRFGVGDRITVLDADGRRHSYRLVGLIDFGVYGPFADASVVGLPSAELTALTGRTTYDEVVASARDGVSQYELASAVRAALGADAHVVTGDQRRVELADEASGVATEHSIAFAIFGVISLVVAAFVIFNTFGIMLAQRVRETALLRCVGANRRQIFSSVLLESLIVGAAGSIAGVAVGVGVALGLYALINGLVGEGLPEHSLVVGATPVVAGFAIGVGITLAAALIPAVRATRTSPLAALRDVTASETPSTAARVVRLAVAALVALGGAAVTRAGWSATDAETAALLIVAGGVVTFLALLIAAPLFMGPLTAAVGAGPRRLFGAPVRLAVANARRNPGRTAVTSATLMVGVALMTLFSVVIASVQETATRREIERFPVDYIMQPVWVGGAEEPTIPAGYAQALRGRAEFAQVVQVRAVGATVAAERGRVAALDPGPLGSAIAPDVVTGRVEDLRTGTAIVSTTRDSTRSLGVGDTVEIRIGSNTARLTVVGTARIDFPNAAALDALLSWDQLAAMAGPGGDTVVMAKTAPGVTPVASRDALDALADQYPLVQVGSVAESASDLANQVNTLIAVFGVLMGTTILIALFGVTNTLSLSVVERTRESGTVRALGLTRGQLRATLLVEAVLMAVIGALVGIAFGLVYGQMLVRRAFGEFDPVVVIPWTWVAGLITLAAVAGVLAAVLPARRASRASVVAALADTG